LLTSRRIGDDPYTLGLFDTSGQEDYDRLRSLTYPQTDVFLVFARVGRPWSYESVEMRWVPEIQHYCPGVPFIIVGIKCDYDEDSDSVRRVVTNISDYKAMGEAIARRVGAVKYLECDIISQYRLKDVFDEVGLLALVVGDEEKIC
jgi:cell division control protein 42